MDKKPEFRISRKDESKKVQKNVDNMLIN